MDKGRLDFHMAEPPADKDTIASEINAMIAGYAAVEWTWISQEALDAQPDLVKTLSVQPPRGAGRIPLFRIGTAGRSIDLQPCGGIYVKSLAEVGEERLGKIEKKGRVNRRVYLHLAD